MRPHMRTIRSGNSRVNIMKTYFVKIKHVGTGAVYSVPVLATSIDEAEFKAGQWPYSNDSYIVLKG